MTNGIKDNELKIKCFQLFCVLIMMNCNKNESSMKWINHGGWDLINIERLTYQSPTIFISSLKLTKKQPIEFSKGDMQIPTVWSMNATLTPLSVMKGGKTPLLSWKGRYRPDYPDPMLEDIFWKSWLDGEEKNVIVYLSEKNQSILHVELYSTSAYQEAINAIQK